LEGKILAKYKDVFVICPCGSVLFTMNNNIESRLINYGSRRCPSCGKEVSYQIKGDESYSDYKE
jgi:ribosomal protein S27AE